MPVLLPLRDFTYARFNSLLDATDSQYIRDQIEDFVTSFCEASSGEVSLRVSSPSLSAAVQAPPESLSSDPESKPPLESFSERQQRRGKEYLRLVESFALVILKDPFWVLKSADGKMELDHDSDEMALFFELVLQYLELLIVPKIHRHLFVPDKKADWSVTVKCIEFEWIHPGHLDLPYLPDDFAPLIDKANSVFTDMAFEQIPTQKADHLKTIWKMIEVYHGALLEQSRLSQQAPESPNKNPTAKSPPKQVLASMDDMFPILIYVLVKSRPPQLQSDLAYISACCRDMSQFGSFTSFQVANTQMALEFVHNLSMEKLSPLKEGQLKALPLLPLQQSLTDTNASSMNYEAPSSKVKTSTPKQTAISGILSMKEKLTNAVGRVADSVNGTVSLVSSISPISAVTSRIKSPGTPTIVASSTTVSEPENTPESLPKVVAPTQEKQPSEKSTIPLDWTLLEPGQASELSNDAYFSSRYPFFTKTSKELSPSDIKQLLQEYRALAVFHYQQTK